MWNFTDEDVLRSQLETFVKATDKTAQVLTFSREVPPNTAKINTTFVVTCASGQFALVVKMLKEFRQYEGKIVFGNSQLNMESGNLEIDFLYIKAEIKPKLN